MAGDALVSDYTAIILRAIDRAQNDPAQMRQLIYDLARMSLGRQLLLSYEEIGSNAVGQHLSALDSAIKQAEIVSGVERGILSDADASQISIANSGGPAAALPSGPDLQEKSEDGAVAVLSSHLAPSNDYHSARGTQFQQAATNRVWDAVPVTSKRRLPRTQFLAAATVGFAIFGLSLVRPDFFVDLKIPYVSRIVWLSSSNKQPAKSEQSKQIPVAGTGRSLAADGSASLGFPLPAVYGVYAVSQDKLYGLQPLAMKVPDPRVAISAMISSPSRLTLPDGKITFVVYRRDLRSSAPETVPVRVVARVLREMKFAEAAPPEVINVAGEWAVRNKSFEFGVTPVGNNPEMIILRPREPHFSFSPGRYALVLRGDGYDFEVAGQLRDTAQCLERTDALGGMVYSECRKIP
jgi:hypothetical protein